MKTNLRVYNIYLNLWPNSNHFTCRKHTFNLLFLFFCAILFFGVSSDCGFIKLLDKIKEYDGENADVITGTFDNYVAAQYSVFGFMRILGDEVKTYSLFKFDNNTNAQAKTPGRTLQDNTSGYDELMSISFSKYNNSGEQVNLLVSKYIPKYN